MTSEFTETFNDAESAILDQYVTNTRSSVFCLRNLPEVIKGALFSRYSRSNLGLRSLLLKEFIQNNEEASFDQIVTGANSDSLDKSNQLVAIKKAQSFYDRILDGYGDDSIGELGGAHLAIESISMLAAKVIQDCRIGGSPLEKSTRYVYFDQKLNGHYQYLREPVLMTSAFRELYLKTCDHLFDTYSSLIPPLTKRIAENFPHDPDTSAVAYKAALRAKVLDCLRGLLPASTLTNMGLYGNGRFFQTLAHKLQTHSLSEVTEIGAQSLAELSKIIPSFVRRAEPDHRHHKAMSAYADGMRSQIKQLAKEHELPKVVSSDATVKLVEFDKEGPQKVAAALLYAEGTHPLGALQNYCRELSEEGLEQILDAASSLRENRRHKSPRALEHASFTFELVGDFGAYRDLQRHRMLTQERQILTCDLGYFVPEEILGTELEAPYREGMESAKKAHAIIATELPEEAQYIVPMGYNIRWYFHANLRALQWLCELRSAPAGHISYRRMAQQMAEQVSQAVPSFQRYFQFVDFSNHDLGRMDQEKRKAEKLEQTHV